MKHETERLISQLFDVVDRAAAAPTSVIEAKRRQLDALQVTLGVFEDLQHPVPDELQRVRERLISEILVGEEASATLLMLTEALEALSQKVHLVFGTNLPKEVTPLTNESDPHVSALFKNVQRYLLNLEGVRMNTYKAYVSYESRGVFALVSPRKHSLSIDLTIPHQSLNDPKGLSEDISLIKRHLPGSTRVRISSSSQLEDVFRLLDQAHAWAESHPHSGAPRKRRRRRRAPEVTITPLADTDVRA